MAALLPTPIDGCEQFTTKNKAMVREGVELSTDKVTELAAGVKVDAVRLSIVRQLWGISTRRC